jgi:hypothetical protein
LTLKGSVARKKAQQKNMKNLYCKIGDIILVKQRGRKTTWEVMEVGQGCSCKAKNRGTGKIKPFEIDESHIVAPPENEIPASLRQRLPKSVAVCRVVGKERETYQLFSVKTLDVISIHLQAVSAVSFDFTVHGGETRWDQAGEEDLDSKTTFTGKAPVKLPRDLASEIAQEVGERF